MISALAGASLSYRAKLPRGETSDEPLGQRMFFVRKRSAKEATGIGG